MADTFARMKQLVGTTAEWAANDIVLGEGEIGVERIGVSDHRAKCGDGVKTWSQLPYLSGTAAAVDAQVAAASVHAVTATTQASIATTKASEASASQSAAAASQSSASSSAASAASSASSAALSSASAGAASGRLEVATFSELATVFGYTSSGGRRSVAAGDLIRVIDIDATYRVLASGASVAHLDYTASGGVKINVLPEAGGCSVQAFGAVGDGVTNDSAAIQAAINFAASNGSRRVLFPQGKNITNGAAYNLGSATITIPASEMKLIGQKYTQIRKSGPGAFFDIPVIGYGFEAEGLWLVGTNVDGQYGFLFSGASNGFYMQGTLEANIHDCWFEAVGKKETVTAAAGGAILATSQTLGLKVEGNICSQGGYLLRVEAGSDGIQVRHNVTNISRSVAVQFEGTAGAASVEISQNNLANVGGGIFVKNAGYCNIFGNACIPGESEAGALGDVVKRTVTAGEVFLTENTSTGVSAVIWVDNCQVPNISQNVCSFGGGARNSDYGIYLSSRQSTCFVTNNLITGYGVAGINVSSSQAHILLNNRSSNAQKDTVYSNPYHPSVIHNYSNSTPTFSHFLGFGTAIPNGPFDFTTSALSPATGYVQVRASNAADTTEYMGFGWDDTSNIGYLQAYKAGSGYRSVRHRSPTIFLGGSNDTSVIVQAGSGQGSKLFQVSDNTLANDYIAVSSSGIISMSGSFRASNPDARLTGIPTYADNAAATAAGLVAGRIYKTAGGDLKIVI